MAQFDVYRNPDKASAATVPFLIDVQSDYLSGFTTRVVVPLAVSEQVGQSAKRLHPQFQIEGAGMIMLTERLAALPKAALGREITSLAKYRDEIVTALEFLVTGFRTT